MAPRSTVDPFARFDRWFRTAERAGIQLPEAAALATADRGGCPSVRFVLVKHSDPSGFVFYTNARSRKGRQLHANPHASLAFYWDPTGKQVCVSGRVEPVSREETDAYWASRPRASRLAGLASSQSATLASRARLMAHFGALRLRLRGKEVPRPPEWKGFRILPDQIEFWTRRAHRLHERELFTRTAQGWRRCLLQP